MLSPPLARALLQIGEPGEHWNPSRHTVPLPTDAYGCIDFRGGSQTNKAQVCRYNVRHPLSYDIL